MNGVQQRCGTDGSTNKYVF